MNMPAEPTVHATCVCTGGAGVLITGPSGSGKSALALELIDTPGHGAGGSLLETVLVADDRVLLERREGTLFASAPHQLAGRLEVRGLGILRLPHAERVPLRLIVRLCPWHEIERMPAPETEEVRGVSLPLVRIDADRPRAAARLRAALMHLGLVPAR